MTFDELKDHLTVAVELLDHEQPDSEIDPDAPLWARCATNLALGATIDFLHNRLDARYTAPLTELLGALVDAECGRSNPILTPRKRNTRTPMPNMRAARLGMATAAVDLLKKNGTPPQSALRQVAKLIQREGMDADKLKGFCKRLRSGRVKNEVAKAFYHLRMAEAQERGAAEVADKIMTWLAPPKDT